MSADGETQPWTKRLEVLAIGPGGMGMSSGYGAAGDRQRMITLIPIAVERVSGSSSLPRSTGPFVNRELVGELLAIPWQGL